MANKNGKVKGLWIGDGVAASGFARVNHSIITNLPDKYDIHHLAINYFGDPHEFNYKIYPAFSKGDIYGTNRVIELINEVQPKFIFILNDVWVIDKYLRILKDAKVKIPVIAYFPIDAADHDPKWYQNFDIVTKAVVYTKFARDVVHKATNIPKSKINIIGHGVEVDRFFPMPTSEAKRILYPVKDKPEFLNSFIVLNANRNQPRKRIDITIRAFAEFAKDKPDNVKLYLHMGTQDMGIDIIRLSEVCGIADRLVLSTTKSGIPGVEDQRLNVIYNACDVGINTSVGEGWGLIAWEHGACRKPQIVPNHSACTEIWDGVGVFYDAPYPESLSRITTTAYVPDQASVANALELVYNEWLNDKEAFEKRCDDTFNLTTDSKKSWKSIADKWDKIIMDVI